MKTIYDEFPDYDEFDEEGKQLLKSLYESKNYFRFRDDEEFLRYMSSQEEQSSLNTVRTTQSFCEISNEVAMDSPFGEKSEFYKPARKVSFGSITF